MSAAAQAVAMRIAIHDLPRLPAGGRGPSRACCCALGLLCVLALLPNAILLVRPSVVVDRAPLAAASNHTHTASGGATRDAVPAAVLQLEKLESDASDERVLRQMAARWHWADAAGPSSLATVDLARAVGWLARQVRASR